MVHYIGAFPGLHMNHQRLHLNYVRGKQNIALATIVITIIGFGLDALTYHSIYSSIQIWVQSISVAICLLALILFLVDRNKHYIFSFGLTSYTVITNILITATIIHTFQSFEKFTEANILSRDTLFMIFYVVLSGFILGKVHIVIQGGLVLALVLYFVFILREPFFVGNAGIYIIATIGFCIVDYFFVGTLNQLISGLEESNIRINKLKTAEADKGQTLLKYQNSIIELTKEKSNFTSADFLFRKVCETVAKNLTTSRVSIWMLEDGNSKLVRRHLFEQSAGNDEQVILERKDFPGYFNALESQRHILANDAGEHPDTREFKEVYLKPLNIISMLDCPIVMDGSVTGVICCEHQGEAKEWGTEDVLFVQSLSEHISIFYKNLEINDLLHQVRNRNFELVEQSNEIEAMNEELNSLNEELTTLNENLERTVKKRTFELETQNQQLTEYAFINSHILRAPLARILGLANLIAQQENSARDKQLLDALIISSNELDLIIRKISDVLYDGNNLSREDIQVIIDRAINKK